MENIRKNNNINDGDIGLWYCVLAIEEGVIISHVCPYLKCKNFEEAIMFYYKTFHRKGKTPFEVNHHKISNNLLKQLALAC